MKQIRTTRFGTVEVADDKIITAPDGMLGFPNEHHWVFLSPHGDAAFDWLQSATDPNLAFVVTDAVLWGGPAGTLWLVNRHENTLTANTAGPVTIDLETMTMRQTVLDTGETRKPLLNLHAVAGVKP